MAKNRSKNKWNQYVSTKPIEIAIQKRLIDIAKDEGIRVKALVRDELEKELRLDIYDSYRPSTKRGIAVQKYNETHKHQQSHPYHHTGRLAQSVYAIIDGDNVKAMIRDEQYEDGASTTEVYDYLKFGTTSTPRKNVYDYDHGTKFASYTSQEPHNFETRTREYMKEFLNDLMNDIDKNGINNINPKYLRKLK